MTNRRLAPVHLSTASWRVESVDANARYSRAHLTRQQLDVIALLVITASGDSGRRAARAHAGPSRSARRFETGPGQPRGACWVSGRHPDGGWPEAPHRVLRNSVVAEWERAAAHRLGSVPTKGKSSATRSSATRRFPSVATPLPPSTMFTGDVEKMALYAGESCGLVNDVRPAGAIVADLARQAETVIRTLSNQPCV